LQQGVAFPGGTGGTLGSVGLGVGGEQFLIELEGVPADVTVMGVGNERGPLLSGQAFDSEPAVGTGALAQAAIDERPGVAATSNGKENPSGTAFPSLHRQGVQYETIALS
jgi:hypothetical protein